MRVKLEDYFFYYFTRSFLYNKSFQILYSWLYSWLIFLLKAWRYEEFLASFLITPWKHLATLLCLLDERDPSVFPLYLVVYILHYSRAKLMKRVIPVVNWPETFIISSSRYISVAISYLLWALGRIWNFFDKLNFQFCISL